MPSRKPNRAMDELTPMQRIFITEYVKDSHATRAAKEAGFKVPHVAGSKLLQRPQIKAALAEYMKPILNPKKLTVQRLARQLSNYIFRTIKDFVDKDGYMITNVMDLSNEAAQCVESWEVEEMQEWDNDLKEYVRTGQRVKVKLVSKGQMQALGMKYMKMTGADINIDNSTQHNTINIGQVLWEEAQKPTDNVVEGRIVAAIEQQKG